MKKIEPVIYLALLFVCFQLSISVSCAATTVTGEIIEDTPWTKENSPYIVLGQVTVKVPLTIKAGTVVKFGKNNSLDSLKIQNDFYVNGTREEPVVFTSIHDDSDGNNSDNTEKVPQIGDWSSLNFNPSKDQEMRVKYAEVRYSSFGVYLIPSAKQSKDISIKKCKFEKNGVGILIGNTEPLIEGNVISNNTTGIKVNNSSNKKTKAINNSIANNETGVYGRSSLYPDEIILEAKQNWWGDKTGPYNEENNPGGEGNSATGQITFDPWLEEDPITFPDPVIIIPGIMGSWEKDGKWQIDPIFHTYDNLYEEFINEGYEPNKDLFTFPYQWRDSNKVNAIELRAKIQEIKNKTNRLKVDIVAHSMGGLLAREYIESSYYEDDVDQLITVGTPHLGAPKDYLAWEGGLFGPKFKDYIAEKIFSQEAKENGFEDTFHYVHSRPISSVKELLPVYDYLYDVENDYGLRASYPDNYPRNEFLESLNSIDRLKALKEIEFAKIIGNYTKVEDTILGFNVVESGDVELWTHGYPEKYWLITGDRGLVRGCGDETVPCYSARSEQVFSNRDIELNSTHGDLPTDAQQDILEILTGKRPENKIDEWHIPNLLGIFVHSPIDIQVESPSGERIGKNFETNDIYDEIEGAYYTGFGTNSEFITIPNPEDGEYKIITQGTNEGGSYKVETTKISEDPENPDNAKESTATIEGEVQVGEIQEVKIEISGDEVIYYPDTTPPVITIFSPEEREYNNDGILAIDFKVEDAETGIASEKWQVEKDGQILDWWDKSIDLSFEHLGDYNFKVFATDQAENQANKEIKFQITTNLDSIQKNLSHYFELGYVKKKIAYKYFSRKLKNLKKLFELLKKIENSKLKLKPKQIAIDALKRIVSKDIDLIIRQINRKSPRWIDENVVDLLIEDLTHIKPGS